MTTFYDYLCEVERYREYIVEAEMERRLQLVTGHGESRASVYRGWLAQLGAQLVVWGNRLQTRYGESRDVSRAVPQDGPVI